MICVWLSGFVSLSVNDTDRTVEEGKGYITFTVGRKGLMNSRGEDQSLFRLSTAGMNIGLYIV